MTDVMPDTALPGLFPQASPPPPMATPDERAELLRQLRVRRRELVDDLAVGLGRGEPLSPSIVEPPAMLHVAIAAVEAELRLEPWDADPDTFNTEAKPPGHDGEQCGDTDT